MTESTIGISAIGQLLPLFDYVDMDGAELIARDVATGVRLEKGGPFFPPKRQRRAIAWRNILTVTGDSCAPVPNSLAPAATTGTPVSVSSRPPITAVRLEPSSYTRRYRARDRGP